MIWNNFLGPVRTFKGRGRSRFHNGDQGKGMGKGTAAVGR